MKKLLCVLLALAMMGTVLPGCGQTGQSSMSDTTPNPATTAPTTPVLPTSEPDTATPATPILTTAAPDTSAPATAAPSKPTPTTVAPSKPTPTTPAPTKPVPTTAVPTTPAPTTPIPTTPAPTTPAPTLQPTTPPVITPSTSRLIVIDPGHQAKGNYGKEPVGPGASETKAKVSSGTQGCVTGLPEYKLNLMVSLKLKQELESRGYTVILTRESHNVDISNAQRAEIANRANADAFIRIHANGSEDSSVHGAMTICQTPGNPYNGALYSQSYALASCVLDGLVASTGCRREYVWKTDTMSGINWCAVPATIVEMGYMSNPEEDRLLSQEDYQWRIVRGIADGLDDYFAANP